MLQLERVSLPGNFYFLLVEGAQAKGSRGADAVPQDIQDYISCGVLRYAVESEPE